MKSNGFSYFSLSIPAGRRANRPEFVLIAPNENRQTMPPRLPEHDEESSKFEGIETNLTGSVKDKS
jgi:hypothetical protein